MHSIKWILLRTLIGIVTFIPISIGVLISIVNLRRAKKTLIEYSKVCSDTSPDILNERLSEVMTMWAQISVYPSMAGILCRLFKYLNLSSLNINANYFLDALDGLVKSGGDIGSVDINLRNANGDTLLIRSVYLGSIDHVSMLLDMGANIRLGATVARELGADDINLMLLLKGGYDPVRVVLNENQNIIRGLIESGLDIHQTHHIKKDVTFSLDDDGFGIIFPADENWSFLHLAAKMYNQQAIEVLIENGADVDITDPKLVTPLHIAARNSDFNNAKILIDAGANYDLADCNGDTARSIAERNNSSNIIALMVELDKKHISKNLRHRSNDTPESLGL